MIRTEYRFRKEIIYFTCQMQGKSHYSSQKLQKIAYNNVAFLKKLDRIDFSDPMKLCQPPGKTDLLVLPPQSLFLNWPVNPKFLDNFITH